MQEIWADVKGFEGLYQVSNKGRLRNNYGKSLRPADNGYGYLRFNLSKGKNNYSTIYLHRAIAQAFIPNPNNYPEVNHIDENKRNNNLENLEWCSIKYNRMWGTRNERTSEHKKQKIVGISLDGSQVIEFDGVVDSVKRGFNKSAISNCLQGLSKSSGGYVWTHA